jgi:hypothetical protein
VTSLSEQKSLNRQRRFVKLLPTPFFMPGCLFFCCWFSDILTVSLGGVGTIEHIVNDTGATANAANQVVDLVSYP